MLFTSISYYLFLFAVIGLVVVLPWRAGRLVILGASYFFYGAAEPWYVLLLLTSTLVDYVAARRIAATEDPRARRAWLTASLTANLGLLGIFKYLDFSISNLNVLLGSMGQAEIPLLDLLLPVGISFYTFQTLSYTIDVYRGKVQPTRDFVSFALYVAFFPQLVAGPIERAARLLPQFVERRRPTVQDYEQGFQRILWGLVKKTVFADRLGLMVAQVYGWPAGYSSLELVIATLGFSFQLYLDFSAYTDIAIGSARMMGIRLSENFNYPFLAKNPSDFWSRWNMTLTAWFRDYAYAAFGGTRRSRPLRTVAAILLVMTLMGLWHGAQWNYVMFGLLSGIMLLGYLLLRFVVVRRRNMLGTRWWSAILRVLFVNIAINFIMIFFRSRDFSRAMEMLSGIASGRIGWHPEFNTALSLLVIAWTAHVVRGNGWHHRYREMAAPLRGAFWAGMALLVLYGAVETSEPFIYFQF